MQADRVPLSTERDRAAEEFERNQVTSIEAFRAPTAARFDIVLGNKAEKQNARKLWSDFLLWRTSRSLIEICINKRRTQIGCIVTSDKK